MDKVYELAVKPGDNIDMLTRAWDDICKKAGVKGRVSVTSEPGLWNKTILQKEETQYGGKEDTHTAAPTRG